MCLAVPGKILSIKKASPNEPENLGIVDFNGNQVEVSLAMVPEAVPGDYVLVHAGYALQLLDEAEAKETWDYLEQAGIEFDRPRNE
jgi:hydrogenase expression/formation protein HypC